jgi:hypothetical protein
LTRAFPADAAELTPRAVSQGPHMCADRLASARTLDGNAAEADLDDPAMKIVKG